MFNLSSSRDGLGATGLNGSGSFPTGMPMTLSGMFPFPPMPMMPPLTGSTDAIASPSSASGSATDVTTKPHATADAHESAGWKTASSDMSHAHHAPQFSFTPLFRSVKHACVAAEQPMAFWKISTNELLSFNEAFVMLIEADPLLLQQGHFRWLDLRVVDRETREVRLNDDAPNALKVLAEFNQQVQSGVSRFAQV